jgi:1,4-alpha-glucan branching enzyme
VLAYVRKAKEPQDNLLVCCNFTPVVRQRHRVGVPRATWYREILNTDSQHYGGSNVGNFPGASAEPIEWHGRPWSISITLPPLSVVIFKPEV